MKKYLILLCLAAFILPAASFAGTADDDKLHPIDAWFEKQINTTGGSTQAMIAVTDEGAKKWDAELNKQYKLLMARLDKSGQNSLKTAQRAWLKFRDTETAAAAVIYGTAYENGSLGRITCGGRVYDIVRARAMELAKYNEEFEPK